MATKRINVDLGPFLRAAGIAREYAIDTGYTGQLPTPSELLETVDLAKRVESDMLCMMSESDLSAHQVWAARQYLAMFRKNSSLPGVGPKERKQAALQKFAAAQTRNKITEKRLNFYFRHPSRMPPLVGVLLASAAMDLQRLLGVGPTSSDWGRFVNAKPFGPGTVQGLQKFKSEVLDVDSYAKVSASQVVTSSLATLRRFGHLLINGAYGLTTMLSRQGELVETSRLTTVAKDRGIDRVIAIEPSLNLMAQFGIAGMLEPKLRAWGINLHSQRKNQQLAQLGATLGLLSTIDLSSASDSIVTALVRYLLPRGWFELIDDARTHGVSGYDGSYFSFSTMGNAVTFPLQCLIYMSLARAASRLTGLGFDGVAVYGDDIIVPQGASLLLIEALRFVGFQTNMRKTFVLGPFRESCGAQWLRGDDVVPFAVVDDFMLRSTRHLLFNQIQRKDPDHPILYYLLGVDKTPLVGPCTHHENISDAYFEAPLHVVHDRVKYWYNSDYQCLEYEIPQLVRVAVKRKRTESRARLLACLTGSRGGSHGLRGTATVRVRSVRHIGHHCRLARYAPTWYF